jgi:hypothetical protein
MIAQISAGSNAADEFGWQPKNRAEMTNQSVLLLLGNLRCMGCESARNFLCPNHPLLLARHGVSLLAFIEE